MDFHLAQINIARLIAPIADPRIADFVAQLDPVNALADAVSQRPAIAPVWARHFNRALA